MCAFPIFFEQPMYIVSYVLSNDAALQLYEMEEREQGSGLTCLESNLDSQETNFMAFTQQAGLSSPFTSERLTAVRQLLEAALQ